MNGWNPDKDKRVANPIERATRMRLPQVQGTSNPKSSTDLVMKAFQKATSAAPFKNDAQYNKAVTSIEDFAQFKDRCQQEAEQEEKCGNWEAAIAIYKSFISVMLSLKKPVKDRLISYPFMLALYQVKLACCYEKLGQIAEYRKCVMLSQGTGYHPLVVYHYAKWLIDTNMEPFNEVKVLQALKLLKESTETTNCPAGYEFVAIDIRYLLAVTSFKLFILDTSKKIFLSTTLAAIKPIIEKDLRAKLFYATEILCKIEGNYPKALQLLEQMVNTSDLTDVNVVAAHYFIGSIYNNGENTGLEQNDEKAYQHFLIAAEHGHVQAQHDLALKLEEGQGRPADYKQAANWYRKAAEYDDGDSQQNLALLYVEHPDCCPDEKDASYWFMRAASHYVEAAFSNLSRYSFDETFSSCDPTISARFWWKLGWLNTQIPSFAFNLGNSFIQLPYSGIDPDPAIVYLSLIPEEVTEYSDSQLTLSLLYKFKAELDENKKVEYTQRSKQAFQNHKLTSNNKNMATKYITASETQVDDAIDVAAKNSVINQNKEKTHVELMSLLATHVKKPAGIKAKGFINFKIETCDSRDTALLLYNLGEICQKQLGSDRRILDANHQRILTMIAHVGTVVHYAEAPDIAMMLDGITKLSLHPDLPIVGKVLHMLYQAAVIKLEQFSLLDLTAVIFSLGRTKITAPLLPFYLAALMGQTQKLINDPNENVSWQVLTMILYTCMLLEESLRDTPIYNENYKTFIQFLVTNLNRKFKTLKGVDLDHRAAMQLHMVERYFHRKNPATCKSLDDGLLSKVSMLVGNQDQKDSEIDDVAMFNVQASERCNNIYTVLGVEETPEAKPPVNVSNFQQEVFDFVVQYFPQAKHDTEKVHYLPVDIYIATLDDDFSLQADGTTHFLHHNPGEPPELNHKSRVNTAIIGKCVRVSYYEWNQCKNDDQRYDYLRGLIENLGFSMPPKKVAAKIPIAANLVSSNPLITTATTSTIAPIELQVISNVQQKL